MKAGWAGLVATIAVDRGSAKPLYRQVYEGLRAAIVEGRLGPGQRLPSTRSLAVDLRVSRIPVLNAFEQLVAEGYVEGRVGSGTFVASLPTERSMTAAGANPRGRRTLARSSAKLVRSPRPWFGGVGAFRIGEVAGDHFPHRIWSGLVGRQARRARPDLLEYGDRLGYAPLREAIAAYLLAARGVRCDAGQIMVVSGSQQALDIAARALLDGGSPVWMEEPGYWGAQDVFTAVGARLVPVPVDDEGLDVGRGIARAPRAGAVFVTPSHQFPLGATMSAARRLRLLDWARRSGAWVIEDDYDSEYRYASFPVAALQGLDRDSRVIYVGTLSKVLFPALRLGYLVVPEDLLPRFDAVRRTADICPPTASQAVLAEFMSQGHFARHLRRMRLLYGERRSALAGALRQELGDVLRVSGTEAGLHLVALLPKGWRDHPICERAAEAGLWVMPLSGCYLGRPSRQGLVLGYGGTAANEIPEAVRRLRGVLEESA